MKSIFKKVAGIAFAATLALGMFSCANILLHLQHSHLQQSRQSLKLTIMHYATPMSVFKTHFLKL